MDLLVLKYKGEPSEEEEKRSQRTWWPHEDGVEMRKLPDVKRQSLPTAAVCRDIRKQGILTASRELNLRL